MGVAFADGPDADPRGLSWSDCAVLFRSVAQDAGPLVDEMRRRGIPYVVKGLNRLFDSPEIQAIVGVFRYMVSEIDDATLRSLWEDADLLPGRRRLGGCDARPGRGPGLRPRRTVGRLQHPAARTWSSSKRSSSARRPFPATRRAASSSSTSSASSARRSRTSKQIYFNTDPAQKYKTFADWLEHQAPDYYAELTPTSATRRPTRSSSRRSTRPRACSGRRCSCPCLRSNRFPAKRQGGLGLFHVIPTPRSTSPDRYRGTVEDETRLFYVAVTRAQKYLFVSYSPVPGNRLYEQRSEFFDHCAGKPWVSDPRVRELQAPTLEPQPRHGDSRNVTLSFSELKYLFECPYQFKLRFLYGFNPPLHEALGYGKGLHDALAEVAQAGARRVTS